MRSILAIAGLLLCASVSAQSIPSAASGVYVGSDRVCRVELAKFYPVIRLNLTCLYYTGRLSNVSGQTNAPTGCVIGHIPFDGQLRDEFVSIRGFDGSNLQIVRGTNELNVVNGIGIAETWPRIGLVASPAPYTCGSRGKPNDRP